MGNIKNERLPKVGDILPAFDDGKLTPSRLYPVKVIEVLPWNESTLNRVFKTLDFFSELETEDIFGEFPLKNAWNFAWHEYDWVFNSTTDYFIVTETNFDYEPIEIFARTKNGGWFSFPIDSYMTGSRLDSNMERFNAWKDSDCEILKESYSKINNKFKINEM